MIVLTIMASLYAKNEDIAFMISITGFVIGLMGIANFIMGMTDLATSGGYIIQSLDIWRLQSTKGFPLFVIIIVLSAIKERKRWPFILNLFLYSGLVLLIVCLILTFKRSLWLLFPVISIFVIMSKSVLKRIFIFASITLAIISIMFLSYQIHTLPNIEQISSLLSYNPDYSLSDTLMDRVRQVSDLLVYMKSNKAGYGFGAQFYTFWPISNGYENVHYIHNLYVFYYLQFGLISLVTIVGAAVWLTLMFWNSLDKNSELNWMIKAGLVCLFVIFINGFIMISTHTTFVGFILGLGISAIMKNNLNISVSTSYE
jgi:O-antigen ligase